MILRPPSPLRRPMTTLARLVDMRPLSKAGTAREEREGEFETPHRMFRAAQRQAHASARGTALDLHLQAKLPPEGLKFRATAQGHDLLIPQQRGDPFVGQHGAQGMQGREIGNCRPRIEAAGGKDSRVQEGDTSGLQEEEEGNEEKQ